MPNQVNLKDYFSEDGRDFYQVLEIERSATDDEIKKAFRKLAKQYHPDTDPTAPKETKEKLEAEFKKVGTAYQILNDNNKRQIYDKNLRFVEEQLSQERLRTPHVEAQGTRPNQPERPRVYVNDIPANIWQGNIEDPAFWEGIFQTLSGDETLSRMMAESTAKFHADWKKIAFGRDISLENLFSGVPNSSTQSRNTLLYHLSQDPAQEVMVGPNNLALLAALVEAYKTIKEDSVIKVKQGEKHENEHAISKLYLQTPNSYVIEVGKGRIRIKIAPAQLLDNLTRMSMQAKLKFYKGFDPTKLYYQEELKGNQFLDSHNAFQAIEAMQSLAETIALSKADQDISDQLSKIDTWERIAKNADGQKFKFNELPKRLEGARSGFIIEGRIPRAER